MKFGKRLEEEVFKDWRFYALEYKALKTRIKAVESFTEADEVAFVTALEREIDKVAAFCKLKRGELVRRIEAAEKTVDAIAKAPHPSETDKTDRAESDESDDHSIGSNDETAEARKIRLANVTEEIRIVTHEVKELASFAALNHTGIKKILKKHDKQTPYRLSPDFSIHLTAKPFFEQTYEALIIRLSSLWDSVRSLHGTGISPQKSPGVDSQNIVRKTTKYWVHPDNVMAVKLLVLRHLPVLLFKKGVPNDPALNSIYFDNDELFLYHERMKRDEGAQNLRFRWYGKRDDTNEVWVERKTHHEDWTGEKSIKERFPIKEKYLNAYLRGEFDIRQATAKLRAEGKKKLKDIEDMERLGDEVQKLVLKRRLRPMVRTSYNRTAFQLPADARVRISLDTELCMVREDGPSRAGDNWRRNDENGYPFSTIPAADVIKFPYAVLEIKLQTQFGQEAPKWATDLSISHLVEAVPKFSKFHHGVSLFHTDKVRSVPFWFYQMHRSILKPRLTIAAGAPTEDVGESADDLPGGSYAKSEDDGEVKRVPRSNPDGPTVKVDRFGKVYFSNERTFLRWKNMSIQIIMLSLFVMNKSDVLLYQYVAAGFVSLAFAVLVWNLAVFHIRALKLRHNDGDGPFEVKIQPIIAISILVTGVVLSCAVGWMAL
ncbi:vacuolar transporter chaperone [Dinochytrium kinnereticum]|nr:vacuolar transporter chaperone [Dinochytrium kinnereticum]